MIKLIETSCCLLLIFLLLFLALDSSDSLNAQLMAALSIFIGFLAHQNISSSTTKQEKNERN
jgi:hypothetical protein